MSPPVGPRRLPGGRLLSKLLSPSLLVSVLLIVHQLGIHLPFGVLLLHLMTEMTVQDGPQIVTGARAVIYPIENIRTGTEAGKETERETGAGREIAPVIEIGNEREAGTGTETETEIEIENR